MTLLSVKKLTDFLVGHRSNENWPPDQARAFFEAQLPKLNYWQRPKEWITPANVSTQNQESYSAYRYNVITLKGGTAWKIRFFTGKFVLSSSDNRNFGKAETDQISKLRKDGDDYGLAYRNTERNQLCRGALTEEIDSKEAVKEAACSNFYFQRIFSILCGISLGDSCS